MKSEKKPSIQYKKFPSIFLRLLRTLKSNGMYLGLSIAISVMMVFAGLLTAQKMGLLTDAALAGDRASLFINIRALAILVIVRTVGNAISSYSSMAYNIKGLYVIREKTADAIEALPVSALDRQKSGDLLSRLNNDIGLIRDFLRQGVQTILYQPLMFLGGFVYTLTVNWKLAIICTCVLPVFMYFALKVTKPVERHTLEAQENKSDLNVLAQDSISGFLEMKSFGLQDPLRKKTRTIIDKILKQECILVWYQTFISPINKFIKILPHLALYFFGGLLVLRGDLTIGGIVIFANLLHYISRPARSFSQLAYGLRELIPGAARVFEMWDAPKEASGSVQFPDIAPGADRPAIEFDRVGFEYVESVPVLENLDLSVPEGDITALVGPSGSGKTTIIRLLSRFYTPTKGEIRLFGTALDDWDVDEARRRVSLVTQDTYLFPDTIYRNIAYGDIGASREQIEEAAERSQCMEFIKGFPEGFDTIVGERGVRLSVGQRQRVSIARAILKNAPVLLLDEATSSLDTESESRFQAALNELIRGKTTIVVAHRLSTIKHATRILVLDAGSIREEGTHTELYESGGRYRELYDNQFAESGDRV